jgi:outer membrane protein OmpU
MNKYAKIGASALAGSLVAFSANAGEMSVSGSAAITFFDYGGATSNNAWTMGDGITISGSGETDGGLAVSLSQVFDDGTLDDMSVSISTDAMGTITLHGKDGSSALGAVDDKMPTAYEEPWFGVTSPTLVNGAKGNNMLEYKSPTVGGATFTATYNQADSTLIESQTAYGVVFSPEALDGLTIGYATQEDDSTGATTTTVDDTTMYATYVYGSITVGLQESEGDSNTDASDIESLGMAVSYAVSDDISISYGEHTVEWPNDSTKNDQESSAISASYTSGGMTVAASAGTVNNLNGSTATANDLDTYEISMSFAF